MSQLILYWLNSRVHLSKAIEDIDAEFKNGYYLGELLNKMGKLPDISKLKNTQTTKAIEQNFELIKEPLKALGVPFNPSDIQSKVGGATLKLLYAIKLKFEGPKSEQTIEKEQKKAGGTGKKEAKAVLAKDLANQMLAEKLEKFQEAKRKLDEKAYKSIAEEKDLRAQTIRKNVIDHNNTIRENKQFMKDWTQQGLKNWYKNQQKAKERIEKSRAFEQTAVDKFKAKIVANKEEGGKEVKEGIEGFERNLQRLGIDIQEQALDDTEDTGEKGKSKKKRQPFSIVSAMTKIREKKTLADFARKEKDGRRRKMQVDQARTQTDIEKQYKETEMLGRLQKEAAKSRIQCYEKWREAECRGLIDGIANAAEMERQKKSKQQMIEYLNAKELENKEVEKKRRTDLLTNRKKMAVLEKEHKAKQRSLIGKVVHQTMMTQILDIVNEAFKFQLSSETKQIDIKAWEGWMKSFVDGDDIVPGGVTSYVSQTKTGWAKETGFSIDPELERYEIVDYMLNFGLWSPQLVVSEAKEVIADYGEAEFPLLITPDASSLLTEPSDIWKWYKHFGEKLKNRPKEDVKEVKASEKLGYVPVKLALGGKRFTPKKEVAKALEEKYGFKIFKPYSEIKKIWATIEEERKAREEKKEEKKEEAKGKGAKPAKQEIQAKKEDTINPAKRAIVEAIKKLQGESQDAESKELNKLIVDFVIGWLKEMYPKTSVEYRGELKKRIKRKAEVEAEIKNLQEEVQTKKGGKGNPKKEQELAAELQELAQPGEKGFIILGFPKNQEQAMLLQQFLILSEHEHGGKHVQEADVKTAKFISGVIDEPYKVEYTDPCALDGFVYIDISKSECKRRAGCRKKNKETGEIYFLNYNIPKEEEVPSSKLAEVPIGKDAVDRIYWKTVASDKDLYRVEDFFSRFKPKVAGGIVSEIWHRANGTEPKENIIKSMEGLVDAWMNIHSANETELVQHIEKELSEEGKHEEEAKKEEKKGDGKEEKKEAKKEEKKEAKKEDKKEVKKEEAVSAGAEEKKEIKKDEEAKEEYKERESVSRGQKNMQEYLNEGMLDSWSKLKEKYLDSMNIIFKFYRKQKSVLLTGLIEMHKQFLSFFERSDQKQQLIDDFLAKLASLLADHPDYATEPLALKEINESVDDLNYKLWKIIEKKKDEATAEREEKMASAWIQKEISNSLTAGHDIMQYEINKFVDASYFLVSCSYYMTNQQLPRLFDEIVLHFDNSLVGDEPYSLIERLFQEAAKSVDQAKFSESLCKEFDLNKDLALALEKEKKITLKRLEVAKYWGFSLIYHIIQLSKSVFEKMDDLIVYAIKDENLIVKEAIKALRDAISSNASDTQIVVKPLYMAPYSDSSFIRKPHDELFSIAESKQLSLPELKELYILISKVCMAEVIGIDSLVDILIYSIKQGKMSKAFSQISVRMIAQIPFASATDKVVNWRQLLFYFALLDFPYPTKEKVTEYKELLTKSSADQIEIGKEEFLKVACWLDTSADIAIAADIKERKAFIHDILCSFDKMLNIGQLIELLIADTLITNEVRMISNLKYWHILFPAK